MEERRRGGAERRGGEKVTVGEGERRRLEVRGGDEERIRRGGDEGERRGRRG